MNYRKLEEILNSGSSFDEFKIVKEISSVVSNNPQSELSRNLILVLLENNKKFEYTKDIINSLVQHVGLYPYFDPENATYKELLKYEFHRPLSYDEDIVFHSDQHSVYRRLVEGDSVVLSAPTSFGKSKIIDAIIALEKYRNIAIIVPTLALIDETRKRLSRFSTKYKVISQLAQKQSDRNIFIFTAERIVAYDELPNIDFFVIDEFYKIDSHSGDNRRAISLNIAFNRLLKMGGQFYLLGPNIENIPEGMEDKFRCYFYPTKFSTVLSREHKIEGVTKTNEFDKLLELCETLDESTLIFCKSPSRVGQLALRLTEITNTNTDSKVNDFCEWVDTNYHPDWILSKALRKDIGIHHGKLPRSIAQNTVKLFNDERIQFLVCTSTLIEGVNTKAKNIIIFDNEIARQKIDFFTFNNIKGRSGRMFEHFIGNVFLFSDAPHPELPFVDFPVYTQDENTPESLLIQIDEEDLKKESLTKIEKYYKEEILPVSVIRKNATVDPGIQTNIAEEIISKMGSVKLYQWTRLPTRDQLYNICEILWKYFFSKKRLGAVFSHKQLAYKLIALSKNESMRSKILDEVKQGRYAAKSIDEAVERVLVFERNWAHFEFPMYLMAINNIQNYILPRWGFKPGDYSYYASQVECLFSHPMYISLDELGIPFELCKKLPDMTDDFEENIRILKEVNTKSLKLTNFEEDIFLETVNTI